MERALRRNTPFSLGFWAVEGPERQSGTGMRDVNLWNGVVGVEKTVFDSLEGRTCLLSASPE